MSVPSADDPLVVWQETFERASLASLSRATFLRRSAVVAGGVAGFGALSPAAAFGHRKPGDPRPIPGGFAGDFSTVPVDPFIHVLPPSVGFEMSTITDFDGVVGAAEIQGTASDNKGGTYWFDADMRFMKGRFVDLDGRRREGVFGFV